VDIPAFFHSRRAPAVRALILFALLCFCPAVQAKTGNAMLLDFSMTRLGQPESDSPTVLVVGGIQGDEPGGFSAATLLATRYAILEGSVWVVPNLNFPSIIHRSRGLYGDMNRKFARLETTDPDFSTVRRIQELIRHPDVGLVLNLHDGSGYYRKEYQSKLRNPARWGQSVIIDQIDVAPGIFMGELAREADQVSRDVNANLIDPLHKIHVHNTNTAAGDREMEKSLSYYAVRNGKAAFGLEASKEFPVELRAYYHLNMVESLLKQAGVRFRRDFTLTPAGVREALRENLEVYFADNRVYLPLEDVRPAVSYLPLPRGGHTKAVTSKPIMAVLPCKNRDGSLCIHYGNRTITRIEPDWREMDDSLSFVRVNVDGRDEEVPFGAILLVENSLMVHAKEGFRVNAIGVDGKRRDESGLRLRRASFIPRFSLDRQATLYRIEVYKNQSFTGMFLVRFGKKTTLAKSRDLLPAIPGKESSLGF
jgi:hypothetical protein